MSGIACKIELPVGHIGNIDGEDFVLLRQPDFIFSSNDVVHKSLSLEGHAEEQIVGFGVVGYVAQVVDIVSFNRVGHELSDRFKVVEWNSESHVHMAVAYGIDDIVFDSVWLRGLFVVIGIGLSHVLLRSFGGHTTFLLFARLF